MNPFLRIGAIVLGIVLLIVILSRSNGGEEQRLKKASESELRRIVEREPSNTRASFYLALQLGTKEGRYEEAYHLLRPIAEKQPDAEDVQNAFAQSAFATKRSEEAIEALRRVIKLNPRRVEARRQLASLYSQHGLFPETIAELESALDANANQPFLWDLLGRTYLRMENVEKAENTYRLLTKHMPMMGGSHVGLGFVALARGDFRTAEEKFREGQKAYRPDERAYVGLARLYQKKPWTDVNLSQVVKDMKEAVQRFPQDAVSRCVLGKAYLRQSQPTRARKELETAARLHGAPSETWQLLASLYRQAGQSTDAAAAEKKYQTALATEREEQKLRQAAAASPQDAERQFALARFYVAHDNLAGAWIHFTRGLQQRRDEQAAQEAQSVRQRLLAEENVKRTYLP